MTPGRVRRFTPQPDRDHPGGLKPRGYMTPPAHSATTSGTSGLTPQAVDPVRPGVSIEPPRNPNPYQPGPKPQVTYQPQGNDLSQGVAQIQGRTPPMQAAPQPVPQPAPQPVVPPTWNGQGNVPPGIVPGQTHHWNNQTGQWEQTSQVPQGYDAYGRPMFGQNQVSQGPTGAGVGPNGQPLSYDASSGQWFSYLPNEIQASQQGTQMQGGAVTGVAPQYAQQPPGPQGSVYDPTPIGPSDTAHAQPGYQDRGQPQGFPLRQAQGFRQPGTVPGYGGHPAPQTGNPPQSPPAPLHPTAGYGQSQGNHPTSDVQQASPGTPGQTPYTQPPQGLPLSPQFEQGRRALEDALAAELAQAGADEAEIKAGLQLANQRLQTDHLENMRRNSEAMNSRGLFGGGAHEKADVLARLGLDRSRQDLALGAGNQYRDISRRRSGAQSNFSKGIADLLMSLANSEAQNPNSTAASTKPGKPKKKKKKAGTNAGQN